MILNRDSGLFLEDRGVTQCGVTLYKPKDGVIGGTNPIQEMAQRDTYE